MEDAQQDLIGDLLVLTELTELSARVPDRARDRWALDCARRALGVDLPQLRPHLRELRWCLACGRARTRHPKDEAAKHRFEDALAIARDHLETLTHNERDGSDAARQAIAAAQATLGALRCVEGAAAHEAAVRSAQAAFEDRPEEARAQARRLLLRAKLIPTGAELLVRLDYAEARGVLPSDPAELRWLDTHRALLMAEDEDGRYAVVLRYLERVFLAEIERA